MKSKYQKQAEAKVRNEAYSKLTTAEKIARLPKDGAKRQRARLTGAK